MCRRYCMRRWRAGGCSHSVVYCESPSGDAQDLVREKDGELAAARAARRRALLPMVAAAAGAAERRVSQEVGACMVM